LTDTNVKTLKLNWYITDTNVKALN
jgi:hypothetical protein